MAKDIRLMQGNQAIAEGAIYAGARFYAGYPITPSSEIAEECSKILPKLGGVYIQMEDEIASIAAIIGASLAGAKAFTATSGPGFSLMQESLGFAVMARYPASLSTCNAQGPVRDWRPSLPSRTSCRSAGAAMGTSPSSRCAPRASGSASRWRLRPSTSPSGTGFPSSSCPTKSWAT